MRGAKRFCYDVIVVYKRLFGIIPTDLTGVQEPGRWTRCVDWWDANAIKTVRHPPATVEMPAR